MEAAEQLIHDTPSKSSLTLLNFLEQADAHTDACAAAGISMIEKDPHYGFSISYIVDNEVVKKRLPELLRSWLPTTPPNRTT